MTTDGSPPAERWTICACEKCGKRVAEETSDDVCVCSPIAKPSRPSPPSHEIEVVPAKHADALAEAVERSLRRNGTDAAVLTALDRYRQANE